MKLFQTPQYHIHGSHHVLALNAPQVSINASCNVVGGEDCVVRLVVPIDRAEVLWSNVEWDGLVVDESFDERIPDRLLLLLGNQSRSDCVMLHRHPYKIRAVHLMPAVAFI